MDSLNTIWDPLRKKNVALTPEERVRQWCIGVLADHCKVPKHLMMSEVGFKLGGKQYRADVIVYDRQAQPLMIVECKRPEVVIDNEVIDQAVRYNMALNVRYILITNGTRTFVCRRSDTDGRYVFLEKVPVFNEMICQQQ